MLAYCSLQCGCEGCTRLHLDFLSAVNSNEGQYGQVQLVLHFNSVEKTFQVPGRHMQELLDVYGLLHTLKLTGAIQCASFQVSIHLEQHLNNVWSRGQYMSLSNCGPGLCDTKVDMVTCCR